mmetsp:Transcript_15173/g.34583  ORF Transcript_15173/g.34583 Transcript_15173/m.34583 type:complete len:204 (+) Transcript_15173:974-1585(+)
MPRQNPRFKGFVFSHCSLCQCLRGQAIVWPFPCTQYRLQLLHTQVPSWTITRQPMAALARRKCVRHFVHLCWHRPDCSAGASLIPVVFNIDLWMCHALNPTSMSLLGATVACPIVFKLSVVATISAQWRQVTFPPCLLKGSCRHEKIVASMRNHLRSSGNRIGSHEPGCKRALSLCSHATTSTAHPYSWCHCTQSRLRINTCK